MKKDIFTAHPGTGKERSLVTILLGGGNPLISDIKRRRNGDVVVCLLHPDGNKSQVVLHPYVSELGALSLNMTIEYLGRPK